MGKAASTQDFLRRTGMALIAALGVRPVPVARPADQMPRLCADLRRLDAEMARLLVADGRTPGLKQRLDAASWAYDRVLLEACATAGVPSQEHTPFEPCERLLAEAGLVAAGLVW